MIATTTTVLTHDSGIRIRAISLHHLNSVDPLSLQTIHESFFKAPSIGLPIPESIEDFVSTGIPNVIVHIHMHEMYIYYVFIILPLNIMK